MTEFQKKLLKFIPSTKYLGVRLQTTGTCFTGRVDEVCSKTFATTYREIGNPYKLSVGTAVKLFLRKGLPRLSYGMDRVRRRLSVRNLQEIKRCFCAYLERVFRVHASGICMC